MLTATLLISLAESMRDATKIWRFNCIDGYWSLWANGPSISVSVCDSCLIPFQCRKAEYEIDDEDIPMENIRYVEPGIKQPNAINLFPLDKYAYAPESNL